MNPLPFKDSDPLIGEVRAALAAGPTPDVDAAWRALSARMDAPVVIPIARARRATRVNAWRWRAAAVAVIAVTGLVLARTRGMETLEAPRGREARVTLPDGSRLVLAAGSRAQWSRRFGRGTRDVQLDGEGYFDVVHDDATPFRVRTRHAVATDVGTRFVVRSWPDRPFVDVAVEEGIVDLRDTSRAPTAARSARLTAGQRGAIAATGAVRVTSDAAAATAWMRGELLFDDTPLDVALDEVGRWYAVRFVIAPSVAGRRVSARLPRQSLDELLATLEVALDVRLARAGDTITVETR
ncbi:MAG: FecR domain-containing protein [Gemmatimonadaceae bacterium]|nr:FecR domain-containing protein [Gemmatimonadaceae bacterium]